MGFAHNFLVLVEVPEKGKPRPIAQFHGDSYDWDAKNARRYFDATGGGRLGFRETTDPELRFFMDGSRSQPKFILATGTREEMEAIWNKARPTGAWINRQDFTYWPLGRNSNSVIYTLARAMGFDITGQPIDPKTGRHIEAPGREIDLTKGRGDAPRSTTPPKRIFGLGDGDRPRERPIAPEQEAPPYDGPNPPRRSAVPGETPPGSYLLGFENARKFADEHRFDPRAELALSGEQNKILSAWVERALAPAISYADLPEGLAGDVLDHAARLTPHAASLVLQKGLNRLAGTAAVGAAAPAAADGAAKRVTEDGWIGPETLAAARNHAADSGIGKVREAVALAAFERGLDGLAKGEAGPDEAPSVFHRSIGRLFRAPDGAAGSGGFAASRPAWASVSKPQHKHVATLQDALNGANRIFGFAGEPLKVDGDLGPKTGAALVAAARAAGPERLTDHLGKRFGIGEPDLMDNPARGFGYALDGEEEERGDDGLGAFA